VQTGHSIAEFAHKHPDQFSDWMQNSQYLVALSTDDEESLKDLYHKLKCNGASVVPFTEPDIGNQLTAICYFGTPEMRKITQKLDLALKC
jgi:hypothetical protein